MSSHSLPALDYYPTVHSLSAEALPEVSPEAPEVLMAKDVVASSDSGAAKFSVRVFRLHASDTQFEQFKQAVLPAFADLEWDLYDVRRAELQLIERSKELLKKDERELLLRYYRGEVPREEIDSLLDRVPEDVRQQLLRLGPCRRKACSLILAAQEGQSERWRLQRQEIDSVAQRVDASDYRSIAREYKPIPEYVLKHEFFSKLCASTIHLVKQARPDTKSMRIVVWMMSCYTWPNLPMTNTPEGIHQDGADYIVSAFVLERANITGGASRVFAGQPERPLLERVLNPGEGLFQADAGSPLRHDVTHIHLADSTREFGVRNILGFDIYLS